MHRRSNTLIHTAAALIALALGSQNAQAQIDTSANPNLFFTLTDLTAQQKSYTLNLNIKAADFFVNAQQDAGSYLFFTLDPTKDAALQAFVTAVGPSLSTARWGVLGMTTSESDPSGRVVYSTLTNNNVVATQTASYDRLFKMSNNIFKTNTALLNYVDKLNAAVQGSTIDITTLATAKAPTLGSSLSSITYAGAGTYPNATNGFVSSSGSGDGDCIFGSALCFGNPVGVSSWFYQATVTPGGTQLSKVTVDEFDNLTNDGYWGFIKDPNSSNYILSYTLPGTNPKSLVSTDQGRARLSFTDYTAESGRARLITLGNGDVANIGADAGATLAGAGTIAAVPEPQTWGLMALGGLLVAATARRRRNAAQGD